MLDLFRDLLVKTLLVKWKEDLIEKKHFYQEKLNNSFLRFWNHSPNTWLFSNSLAEQITILIRLWGKQHCVHGNRYKKNFKKKGKKKKKNVITENVFKSW